MCSKINSIRQGYWRLKPVLPDAKRLIYFSPNENYSMTKNSMSLLSKNGEELSSIVYYTDASGVNILDIASNPKGFGYGTKLLRKFIQMFRDCKINVSADIVESSIAPHKFYMKNGFVPIDKNAEIALNEWISKGGDIKDFPRQYACCTMVRNA